MSEKVQVGVIWTLAIVAIIAVAVFMDSSMPKQVKAQQAFDHSNCQYPNRLSNPPDGCDNSDPARPECMKIGIEDCDLPYPGQPEKPDTSAYETPEYQALLNSGSK